MAEKQCGKCGEMVDEAKAFCPGCGNAFVEEKERTTKSDFDLSAHTVRLGDTMYNQMLSDMGLNVSKSRKPDATRVETIAPAVAQAPAVGKEGPAQSPPPKSSNLKWILIGIAAFFVILALLVIVAAVAIILYSR